MQSLQVFGFIRLFDEVRAELVRDHFDFFNSFEEERIIILASQGFEPTHLCDPSGQRRLLVEGLADCATATQGSSAYEKLL